MAIPCGSTDVIYLLTFFFPGSSIQPIKATVFDKASPDTCSIQGKDG